MNDTTDHIRLALERAQTERQSVRSWVRPSGPTAATAMVERFQMVDGELHPKTTITLDTAHLRAHHVLCGEARDAALADRYRLLRTKLIQSLRAIPTNTLGVTSPGPKDGKTITSINLALSLARDGAYKVVLVDADLRKPTVADVLGFRVTKGLVDCLARDTSLDDVLLGTNLENLLILPGRIPDSAIEVPDLLSSERLHQLIESFQSRERHLFVFDLPPARLGDDVVAIAPYIGGIVVVVREGSTSVDDLRETAALLKDFRILGSVLNDSADRKLKFEGYYYHGGGE